MLLNRMGLPHTGLNLVSGQNRTRLKAQKSQDSCCLNLADQRRFCGLNQTSGNLKMLPNRQGSTGRGRSRHIPKIIQNKSQTPISISKLKSPLGGNKAGRNQPPGTGQVPIFIDLENGIGNRANAVLDQKLIHTRAGFLGTVHDKGGHIETIMTVRSHIGRRR